MSGILLSAKLFLPKIQHKVWLWALRLRKVRDDRTIIAPRGARALSLTHSLSVWNARAPRNRAHGAYFSPFCRGRVRSTFLAAPWPSAASPGSPLPPARKSHHLPGTDRFLATKTLAVIVLPVSTRGACTTDPTGGVPANARVMRLFKELQLKSDGAGGASHREVSNTAFRAALGESQCGLATAVDADTLFDKARAPSSSSLRPASPGLRSASPGRQPASPGQRSASPKRAKPRSAASPSAIAANGGGVGGSGSGGSGGGSDSRASAHSYGLAASGRTAPPPMPVPLPAPPPPPPSFACCYLNGRCASVAPLLLRIGPPRDLASLLAQVRQTDVAADR